MLDCKLANSPDNSAIRLRRIARRRSLICNVRGLRGLPVRCDAVHPSADRFHFGATHGWHGSDNFSLGVIFGRLDLRSRRVRHGPGGVWRLFAHPDTDPDRGLDRRLRLRDAGLRRLGVAARGAMAKCGAIHRRRTDWRAGRHDAAHLYRPGPYAHWRRRAADCLQHLQFGAAGDQN